MNEPDSPDPSLLQNGVRFLGAIASIMIWLSCSAIMVVSFIPAVICNLAQNFTTGIVPQEQIIVS
jgi:hypothetical protein